MSDSWQPSVGGNNICELLLPQPSRILNIVQFDGPSVVAFQVIDSLDGDSAAWSYAGDAAGLVRPLLKWRTQSTEMEASKSAMFQSSLNDECSGPNEPNAEPWTRISAPEDIAFHVMDSQEGYRRAVIMSAL